MYRKVLFGKEAREKLIKGVNIVCDAVKTSLGPKGRNTVIGTRVGAPHITKDGYTIARNINLVDVEADMGAQMVKQAAFKTVAQAGDGTTTSTVLAQAIVNIGLKYVEEGGNPVEIKKGIDFATKEVVKFISEFSKHVKHDSFEIQQIATISANGDSEIGKLIADAMIKVGTDGSVSANPSNSVDTTVDLVEGMQVDRGYINQLFCTDFHKLTCEMNDVYVLLYDKKITQIADLKAFGELMVTRNKAGLIICEGVEGEAHKTLIANKLEGRVQVCAVNAPGVGIEKMNILQDIASVTNGTVISTEAGIVLSTIDADSLEHHIGKAERVYIDRNSTVIFNDKADQSMKIDRTLQLRSQIREAKDDTERDSLKSRLAKMIGGIAVINVGAHTEAEMGEKKDRIDDAIAATKAAIEEGVVPGGGTLFLRAHQYLGKKYASLNDMSNDFKTGFNIVEHALLSPFTQIMLNSGLDASRLLDESLEKDFYIGYNAKEERFEDLISSGVIDPAKVSRVALENAASIAGMILTTECVLSLETEEGNKNE